MSAPIRWIGECARAQSKDVIAEVSNHFLDLASCRRQPLSESRISCQPDRHLKIQAHPEQGLKGSFVQFPLQLLPTVTRSASLSIASLTGGS